MMCQHERVDANTGGNSLFSQPETDKGWLYDVEMKWCREQYDVQIKRADG